MYKPIQLVIRCLNCEFKFYDVCSRKRLIIVRDKTLSQKYLKMACTTLHEKENTQCQTPQLEIYY